LTDSMTGVKGKAKSQREKQQGVVWCWGEDEIFLELEDEWRSRDSGQEKADPSLLTPW
jgi:hypothetical protein